MKVKNPFEYEAASNLSVDRIIDFYIEDFNYSRFLQSTKNIFLFGERGSGKTMTLLYNSFKVQRKKMEKEGKPYDYSYIGVHIPCNTPLFQKREYLLLNDDNKRFILCEHYFALYILYSISLAFEDIDIFTSKKNISELLKIAKYTLGIKINSKSTNFFTSIKNFAYRQIISTQTVSQTLENIPMRFSFASIVIPFIDMLQQLQPLKNSHILLMFDDVQDMNKYQIKMLNSWIAFRDHTSYSFKVATTKVNKPISITATGGTILEGHDYISIDMEKTFQNKQSDFYSMAKRIIEKRLKNIGINKTAEEFFPENRDFKSDIENAKNKVTKDAKVKYPNGPQKSISDYIYKYTRAEYFRCRAKNANLPPYSGFQTIVDLSTGVIRNLLDPCYWMFDSQLSINTTGNISEISPKTQNEIIRTRSNKLWEIVHSGLDTQIEGCNSIQAKQIFQLLDNLMVLFKKRLLAPISEPRAIVFSITNFNTTQYNELLETLRIAQKAQLIYIRLGSSKELGKQDVYYIPNRMLFPARGLDPHGQYARVSLKAEDLWKAAKDNIPFPSTDTESSTQASLNLSYE